MNSHWFPCKTGLFSFPVMSPTADPRQWFSALVLQSFQEPWQSKTMDAQTIPLEILARILGYSDVSAGLRIRVRPSNIKTHKHSFFYLNTRFYSYLQLNQLPGSMNFDRRGYGRWAQGHTKVLVDRHWEMGQVSREEDGREPNRYDLHHPLQHRLQIGTGSFQAQGGWHGSCCGLVS